LKIESKTTDGHVSQSVRRILTFMTAPSTLQRGDGEFGIGTEHVKAEIRAALSEVLGRYPWYEGP